MLTGVKVLDLTRVLAGPLCTMLLGDLGADVVKVERPGNGDETRGWGPPFDAEGRSAYYLSINRNKLGITADFDLPEDRALIEGLIAEADVVVDNFRVGTLERRGVSPAAWCDRRPELIWCTITGFGADVARPGYDFVTQAECGWMAITGEPDGDPMKVGVALADVLAGKDAAIAILASLFRKAARGKGRSNRHFARRQRQGGSRECCAKRPVDGQGREALGERASESRSVSTLQGGGPTDRDRGGNRRTMGRVCSRPRTFRARRRSLAVEQRRTPRPARKNRLGLYARDCLEAGRLVADSSRCRRRPERSGAIRSRDASRYERVGADGNPVERGRKRSSRAARPQPARRADTRTRMGGV